MRKNEALPSGLGPTRKLPRFCRNYPMPSVCHHNSIRPNAPRISGIALLCVFFLLSLSKWLCVTTKVDDSSTAISLSAEHNLECSSSRQLEKYDLLPPTLAECAFCSLDLLCVLKNSCSSSTRLFFIFMLRFAAGPIYLVSRTPIVIVC